MASPLVLQTDFGRVDGAVSAMYGVAYSVDENLRIFDLTHEIRPFDVWEASYRVFYSLDGAEFKFCSFFHDFFVKFCAF